MKIEPSEPYDQEVFSFLKEIEYLLRRSETHEVCYVDTYRPFNKNFFKTQMLIDKLAKKKVFKIIDAYEVKGGSNPDYQSVNFILKVSAPDFERLYKQYKKAFELSRNIKLVIYKSGLAELITTGKSRRAKFSPNADSFKVLMLLAKNKDVYVSFTDIAKAMKQKPERDTTEERRARDAVAYIKSKKFNYKEEDFIQTSFGFRLVSDVEIKS